MATLQDNAKEIIALLERVKDSIPNNVMKMYFVEKPSHEKFNSFMPQVANDIQKKILEMVIPNVIKSLQLSVVMYNPVGVADGEIELLNPTQVQFVQTFLNSINPDNLFTEMDQIRIGKIGFYCIELSMGKDIIYLFRQFSKMNRIRNSFIGHFFDNELREMDNDFLGIDEYADMVLLDDMLIILNHISLERIFNYRDEFLKITNAAIGEIVNQECMVNVDQFADDCRRDVRIMKRFTELMSKERLPLFFDHYDKVPEICHNLELDIDFDEDGKLIYREKSQLFHIINLMSDSYFRSLLAERIGVAKTEEPINVH